VKKSAHWRNACGVMTPCRDRLDNQSREGEQSRFLAGEFLYHELSRR
jgi:hypothetical protein